jgi:hypothetical protein
VEVWEGEQQAGQSMLCDGRLPLALDGLEQLLWVNVERFGELLNVVNRQISYFSFDFTDKRPMELGAVSKGLLGDTFGIALDT